MDKRTYRMIGLVPYNLSPIQQGIQFGHAVQEYNNEVLDLLMASSYRGLILNQEDKQILSEFEKWARIDKTFIILNGGTTNTHIIGDKFVGTLNQHLESLNKKEIKLSTFYEPDLGDQLTAIVFLIDDRVFDRESWPDYSGLYLADGKTPEASEYKKWKMKFSKNEKEADKIIFLRDWLKNFKLA